MNLESKHMLLALIVKTVESDPSFFPEVVTACHQGIIEAQAKAMARACDFETAIVSLLEMNKKGQRNKSGHRALALSMLERYRNNTAIAWKAFEQYFPELQKTEESRPENGQNNSK